jgi:hypothetical protein
MAGVGGEVYEDGRKGDPGSSAKFLSEFAEPVYKVFA